MTKVNRLMGRLEQVDIIELKLAVNKKLALWVVQQAKKKHHANPTTICDVWNALPDTMVPVKLNLSGVQDAGAFNFRRPVTPRY